MDTIDELIQADGQVHPAEAKFRGELAGAARGGSRRRAHRRRRPTGRRWPSTRSRRSTPLIENHPFFDQFEQHYTRGPRRA